MKKAGVFVAAFTALAFGTVPRLSPRPSAPQKSGVVEAPGPLSAFHAQKPGIAACASCHAPDGDASPEKCLSCHEEIASRLKEGRGFHRDKAEGCGTCHAEHEGPNAKLVPLDPGDFDHAETGFLLEGGHARVGECLACHDRDNSFQRATGRSYLLRHALCADCHDSPHPGRQEECLACHSMEGWRFGRAPAAR